MSTDMTKKTYDESVWYCATQPGADADSLVVLHSVEEYNALRTYLATLDNAYFGGALSKQKVWIGTLELRNYIITNHYRIKRSEFGRSLGVA